jgi:hypothetical protein
MFKARLGFIPKAASCSRQVNPSHVDLENQYDDAGP